MQHIHIRFTLCLNFALGAFFVFQPLFTRRGWYGYSLLMDGNSPPDGAHCAKLSNLGENFFGFGRGRISGACTVGRLFENNVNCIKCIRIAF